MQLIEPRIDAYVAAFKKRLNLQGIEIPACGILAGKARPDQKLAFRDPSVEIGWDNAHFPLGYGYLLEQGIPGIISKAEAHREGLDENALALRQGIAGAYRLLLAHIQRHYDQVGEMLKGGPDDQRLGRIRENLKTLVAGPPRTFEQGLQLFWFLWRARQYSFSSCIGRMDVFLRPLYDKSVHTEADRQAALDVVCELWEKLNTVGSGDTLMNVMLGGVDENGADISSDLSLLLMEATIRTAKSEPHINLRYHRNTPHWFVRKSSELIAMGQGQGVQYHDEAHIPSLVEHGVPLELARLYANDGCTELTIDGKSGIQFWQMEMVKTLELCLFRGGENPCRPHKKVHKWTHRWPADYYVSQLRLGYDSGDPLCAESFEEFYQLFLRQLDHQLAGYFDRMDETIRQDKETTESVTSLLVCGGIPSAVADGTDPLRGGFAVDNYQLLSGSIPTTADCLAAIKEVVFDRQLCSIKELLEALAANFTGYGKLRNQLLEAPKFGNGIDSVDNLAADIAEHFLDRVDSHPSPHGVRIWPGIYNIDFNLFASILGATPDGRLAGEMICDHYSPTPGRAKKGPTAALRSAAKASLHRGCAASPVYIALPAGPDMDTAEVISDLTAGIRSLGLPLVSIAVNDRQALEGAMEHPEQYENLIVRVWGYNARFIDLDRTLQQHIVNRIL